jgi:hypothetical protein
MRRVLQLTIGAVASLMASAPAQAGVLADDLSRCVVTKATDADNSALMAWMFSAISSDPKLQKFTTLDRSKRDAIDAEAANVFQRLLLVDCRKEAVAALKAEGYNSVVSSFGALGESASRQMFRSPEASAELEALGKHFDDEKLKALKREAGIPEDADDNSEKK